MEIMRGGPRCQHVVRNYSSIRNFPSVLSILQADGSAFLENRILLGSNWAWSLSRQPLPIAPAAPSTASRHRGIIPPATLSLASTVTGGNL